jgi:hypothetical protein
MRKLVLNKADASDCIEHTQKRKYGSSHGKKLHRIVFEQTYGYLPEVVMHTCDNPRCLNPQHLKAGTWDENNKDRAAKGRSARAVPSRRKITQEQAEEIRRRWELKKPGRDKVNGVLAIAKDYEVDPNVIYNITRGVAHFATA